MKTTLLLIILSFASSAPLAGVQVEVIQQALPPGYCPVEIVAGPDGAMWFTSCNGIGRSTTQGVVTVYPTPTTDSEPWGIAVGPDGALWFTEYLGNNIGRITTAGVITEYPLSTPECRPYNIVAGPDGALWFTESAQLASNIGRITTGGAITQYPTPTPGSSPQGITVGPDGALWFAEWQVFQIGRVTTSGSFAEYSAGFATYPTGIASGSDGALWFTENNENAIGRMTTAGALTQYPLPAGDIGDAIVPGPGGVLWFTETGAIASITNAGVVTEYPAYGPPLTGISEAPAGNLWYVGGNLIGQVVFPTADLVFVPATGVTGTPVTLYGSAFGPNENVKLYADNTSISLIGNVTADASGAFSLPETVGATPIGFHSVIGAGQSSGKFGVAPFTIEASLTVTPNAGVVGSAATVRGFSYEAGEEVKVYWEGATPLGTTTADSSGSFVLAVTIPQASPGSYNINGKQIPDNLVATAVFTVE